MAKLFSKICILFSFFLSFYSNSSLLVNCDSLANETCSYITYEYNNVEYDVVWASSVNSERWYFNGANGELDFNELYAPTIYSGLSGGWGYAGLGGLPDLNEIFSSDPITGNKVDLLSLFKPNGTYIHAFEYWNSAIITLDTSINNNGSITGEVDLERGDIQSSWSWSGVTKPFKDMSQAEKGAEINAIMNASGSSYDTFYVRAHVDSKSVPEPSTLLIFALGLIALASKKRLFSSK